MFNIEDRVRVVNYDRKDHESSVDGVLGTVKYVGVYINVVLEDQGNFFPWLFAEDELERVEDE